MRVNSLPEPSPTGRRPRFERAEGPGFVLTERDEDIIKLVARHRFMRSTHIIALIAATHPGSSEQQIVRRLRHLFDAGYLSRPKAQVDQYRAGAGSSPMVYILGNHGIALLAAKFGFRRAAVDWTAKARTAKRGEIEHAIEVTDVMVALDVACRRRGTLRVLYFDEILATVAPEETRVNPKPYFWRVPVTFRRREAVIHPIPDQIFGIVALDRPAGRNRKFFFFEADRGTMPAVRLDLSKTSFLRKLLAYGETYRRDLHTQIYGFPNMRVLTVTRGRKRVDSIIAAHREHTWQLCAPGVFLFADRTTLLGTEDFFSYQWLDAAGERHSFLE